MTFRVALPLIFLIQLTFIFPLSSQNSSVNKVDSLSEASLQKFGQLEFVESLRLAEEAKELSVQANYSKGKVVSYIYIAKVLTECGFNKEAIIHLERAQIEPFYTENIRIKTEVHRLKGKIYGSQHLYTLAKEEFMKQLNLSRKISDPKESNLSQLWAYQNIEHLYSMQGINDSIEAYQDLQESQLIHFKEEEAFFNISTLYASKGRLYANSGKFDEAEEYLLKSISLLRKYNSPYQYYTLQICGDLEALKGNSEKSISYYKKALENSLALGATSVSCELYKKLGDYLLDNNVELDKAKLYLKKYTQLNDSLERHNTLLIDSILEGILKEKDELANEDRAFFKNTVLGVLFVSLFVGALLISRNMRSNSRLKRKEKMLTTTTKRVEELEEEIDNTIFNDIVELAKSNSPEFLSLFSKGYPEFVEAIKRLDPNIRSSELSFFALAFLNFSTKDIAAFTFVTPRAVQIRKNRMRKKYDIPSEVDFNKWTRELLLVQNSYRVVT